MRSGQDPPPTRRSRPGEPPPWTQSPRRHLLLYGLCTLLGGAGLLHLVVPGPYARIMPGPLRQYAAQLVFVSGLCEIGCAALLAAPRTRRLGAYATAALFVAVFPANVQMALDTTSSSPLSQLLTWLRLPLQAPLILWALHFRGHPAPRD